MSGGGGGRGGAARRTETGEDLAEIWFGNPTVLVMIEELECFLEVLNLCRLEESEEAGWLASLAWRHGGIGARRRVGLGRDGDLRESWRSAWRYFLASDGDRSWPWYFNFDLERSRNSVPSNDDDDVLRGTPLRVARLLRRLHRPRIALQSSLQRPHRQKINKQPLPRMQVERLRHLLRQARPHHQPPQRSSSPSSSPSSSSPR